MKKLALVVLSGLLTLALLVGQTVSAADVNNFQISSYDVSMKLGRDSENRSTLETKETITADFPSSDQNRGITRAFVKNYNGHPTSFKLVSVTDESGKSLDYNWSDDVLRIGRSDEYVHGAKTYVITYTQRDVTRYYADTAVDEFYWDVVGFDWAVPITKATAELTVDPSLDDALSGGAFCYYGVFGSNTNCELAQTAQGSYKAEASNLDRRQGITFAVGFNKDTFAPYKQTLFEKFLGYVGISQIVTGVIGLIALIWLVIVWYRSINRTKEVGAIAPEYLPPKNASVTTAARVGKAVGSVMTAQLLDLAVRHFIKIYEVKEKSLFGAAEYEIEIIKDISELRWEEQELLRDTFGTKPEVGDKLNLKKLQNSVAYYKGALNNDTDLDKLIRGEYDLRNKDEVYSKKLGKIAKIIFVFAILTLSLPLLILALITLGLASSTWRLTDQGLGLRRYLKGLDMYISAAEVDRIQLLQSPGGAEKVRSVTTGTDEKSLIKLYEKVLPYAVLFNKEKDWSKQLGRYYEAIGTAPDWYAGQSGVFNAAVFSGAMSGLSQASSSASSYSSSSGGSGGGGSAGGGGGGGGGGGW